jgi:hypothetical protein
MRLPGLIRSGFAGLVALSALAAVAVSPPAPASAQADADEAPAARAADEANEAASNEGSADGDATNALAEATAEAAGEPTGQAAIDEYRRPVLVIPVRVTPDRVPEEATAAIAGAVASLLGPAAEGRPTQVVDDPAILEKFANCPTEPPAEGEEGMTPEQCLGAGVAITKGEAGVVVRLDRRRPRRSPYQATITVRARRTGEVVGGPIEVSLEQDGDYAALLAEPLTPLEDAMPPPPPRQFLLIAANTDGAEVRVDGEPVGETPLAPVELDPGQHVVQVAREGVGAENRTIQMRPGQDLRINVDFDPESSAAEGTRYDWETGELVQEEEETPWYLRWYTIAGASAVVVAGVVVAIVLATGDDESPRDPLGQPIPPLQ